MYSASCMSLAAALSPLLCRRNLFRLRQTMWAPCLQVPPAFSTCHLSPSTSLSSLHYRTWLPSHAKAFRACIKITLLIKWNVGVVSAFSSWNEQWCRVGGILFPLRRKPVGSALIWGLQSEWNSQARLTQESLGSSSEQCCGERMDSSLRADY